MLTGHKDTDRLVLLQLEDHELGPVCQVNKYVNELCKEDLFWKMRVLNKFNKSLQLMIKTFKEKDPEVLKILNQNTITYEQIEETKRFYGFETFKEFNNYLNKLPLIILANLIYDSEVINDEVENSYEIDINNLPKFVNYQELIYELRRKYQILKHHTRSQRFSIDPNFNFPGFEIIYESRAIDDFPYKCFQILGIKD